MQSMISLGHRGNMSDDVAAAVRKMILDGHLEGGERINEVHLAAELNVSRTPLREALTGLLGEGALDHVPRRGYFVRPLTVAEVEDIYPIRAYLDPEALRMAGLPSRGRLRRLDAINRKIADCTSVRGAIELDDAWHVTLWEKCPNTVLRELIHQFMRRTRRYELALMSDQANIDRTTTRKREITSLLRRGELDDACTALRTTLMTAKQPIIDWLVDRQCSRI